MPQMAPIGWLILFIFFCISFILFNSMNYFCFSYSPYLMTNKFLKKNKNIPLSIWKW